MAEPEHPDGEGAPREGERGWTRRGILNLILTSTAVAWLGGFLYPLVRYLKPPEQQQTEDQVELSPGDIEDLRKQEYTLVRLGRQPVIVIHHQGNFYALSARCTHLACLVQWRLSDEVVWCACHNGIYDLKGRVVSGPPPKPLLPYRVVAANGLDGRILVLKETS